MRYLSMPEAVEAVSSGQLIVYPTETFFGIGGLALREESVLLVYQAKKRSPAEPLPVIIGHEDQLPLLAAQVPDALAGLLRALWPGPLTVIFPAGEGVPAALLAGGEKVAVRLTSHPAARELCLHCGPLTASSANIAGQPPTVRADGISAELLPACAGVLAAAPSPRGGQPSTLIEMIEPGLLRIIRPGAVSPVALRQLGWKIMDQSAEA